jgi:predicted ATPase
MSLPSASLPDLCVITGVNGSGKSHLLEAIQNGAVSVEGVVANETEIRLFNWTNLVPNTPGSADPVQLSRERTAFLKAASDQFSGARQQLVNHLAGFNLAVPLPLHDVDALLKLQQADLVQNQQPPQPSINHWMTYTRLVGELSQRVRAALGGNLFIEQLLLERAESLGVHVSSLSLRQIDDAVPFNWNPTDMFQQNFSQIFAAYHRALDANRYNAYANQQHQEDNVVLTDTDFYKRFGEPPWIFVNRLLEEAHLDFEINYPTGRAEHPFEAKLRDKTTQAEISFQDLSSGEKIIMSFTLCLYNVTDKTRQISYPKLLLFDEVDAPLHPSMTQDLIRVIDRVLVKGRGVKVILTTHSPATVAFSPTNGLYRLQKQPRTLTPSSREQAIQTLTSGYISVTENTKFVITEAKQDRLFYTAIVRKLVERTKLSSSPNLVFVQATDKKDRTGGGRGQVKDWGSKLPAAGLTQIFGLIDKDAKNVGSGTIKVLPRYSFENYLFDPLIIYAVLMHYGEHLRVYDAGIKDANYYELRTLDEPSLQKIADAVCAVIEKNSAQVLSVAGGFGVQYISGKTLTLPLWLRDFRGHDLEAAVRETFRAVVTTGFVLTQNECVDLVDMLTERLPEFIPVDLVHVLEELQVA